MSISAQSSRVAQDGAGWDDAAVHALAGRLRLALDPRRRLRQGGARLGARPGASLEFHDHRAYQPGDDLRHLDWGVYARTDQLVLRRHRAEVSPRLELLLDTSASMALTAPKRRLALALGALLLTLARAEEARAAVFAFGAGVTALPTGRDAWRPALEAVPFAGAAGLEADPVPRLSPGAERVIVSDGLCPGGGAAVTRRLGREAGSVALVQVLTRFELDPTPLGPVRLEDVEGGALDLMLDDAACAVYRERFERHQAEWRAALHGRGPGVITVVVEDGLEAAGRALVAAGLLEAVTR
ncbi:MAG: DUF58 domain-containing protein [Deltaproteobacteria bacterium HGW-Deltaproteobacteria-14]|nr:MAG: DUF58 domain-containing protein [Deltaproteobacteria bacterium HGW-Deltaproteobacteria-14]